MSLSVPLRKKKAAPAPSFPSTALIDLLPGEITVAQATKVQQLLYFRERSGCPSNHPVVGTLLCTNRRVSFVPDGKPAKLPDESGRCLLEASSNIPLTTVHKVSIVANKSRKVLDGMSTLPKHLSYLQILCKDVRKVQFSLKNCPKSEASSLVNAIGRHTHPNSVHLLFAYDYTRALKDSRRRHDNFVEAPPIPSFLSGKDWQRELLRLGVTNDQWRVSEANKHFLVCGSLCPFIPCPTSFPDALLESAASVHSNSRIPVWCWSHPRSGVSLTRGGNVLVDDEQEAPDPNYRVSIAMARNTDNQVENKGVKLVDILRKCGSIKQLQSAFKKMRELCTPLSASELNSMDRHWFGGLESSGWLAMVRASLVAAKEVTHMLCIRRHGVMLFEESGSDFSCVVSSLVELMADPHYRSISGFESLVQKEWVALGHAFTSRHGLVVPVAAEEDRQIAPVFLLFLDCVWQLSKQFPSAFEFSEFFLLNFYNVVLDCLYNNFLYDSTKHRLQASMHSRRSCFFGAGDEPLEMVDDYEGPLFSAWGRWREAMGEEENERCLNPLFYVFGSGDNGYDDANSTPLSSQFGSLLTDSTSLSESAKFGRYSADREITPVSTCSADVDYYQRGLLIPETSLCSLRVWDGFFLCFVPELGRCHAQSLQEVQMLQARMVKDVQKLKEELNEMELSMGAFTTDLPSCIGEVVQAREREIMDDRRESVEVGIPLRPRLTASMYSYSAIEGVEERDGGQEEEEEGGALSQPSDDATPVNSPHSTPTKIQQQPQRNHTLNGSLSLQPSPGGDASKPAFKQTSLAQFTDALYSSEMEEGPGLRPRTLADSPGLSMGTGRSPVTKTRLRVVKSEASADPVVAAWQQGSPRTVVKFRESRTERSPPAPPSTASDSQLTEL